tara:strand:+ start:513 stop:1214 length:702 start_codon:yes stop_codon:yes gene_type:complete
MKVGIMQPYLFPYIGYFQLIKHVDKFVIYDNIEYTKKGWINRNRILFNNKDEYFTVPLKKDSDYLAINERSLAENRTKALQKIVNRLEATYRKAPYFEVVFPLIKSIFLNEEYNLFNYLKASLTSVLDYLEIRTELVVASEIPIDHNLKSQDKVIAICKGLGATEYINPIGGTSLYSKETFSDIGLRLYFLKSEMIEYPQLENEFIPWLSIIDVMMFNSKETINEYLTRYDLI